MHNQNAMRKTTLVSNVSDVPPHFSRSFDRLSAMVKLCVE
jgi:hypothetical protein